MKGIQFPKGMMEQLKNMQKEMLVAQKELAKLTVMGESGKGAVKVTITGDQRCTEIEIDSQLLNDGDAKNLEKLVKKALNKALEESREMASDRLGPLSTGLAL